MTAPGSHAELEQNHLRNSPPAGGTAVEHLEVLCTSTVIKPVGRRSRRPRRAAEQRTEPFQPGVVGTFSGRLERAGRLGLTGGHRHVHYLVLGTDLQLVAGSSLQVIHQADEDSAVLLGQDRKEAASQVVHLLLPASCCLLGSSSASSALAAFFSAVQRDQREGAVLSRCDHLQRDRVHTRREVRHRDAAGEGRSLCECRAAHVLLEKADVRKHARLQQQMRYSVALDTGPPGRGGSSGRQTHRFSERLINYTVTA